MPGRPRVKSAEGTVSSGRPVGGGAEGAAHLRLREHQRGGHLEALGPRQVLVEFELVLQLQQLLAGEGRARPAALPQEVRLSLGWGRRGREAAARLSPPPTLTPTPPPHAASAGQRCPPALQSRSYSFSVSAPSPGNSVARGLREPRIQRPGGTRRSRFNGTKSFYLRLGLGVLIKESLSLRPLSSWVCVGAEKVARRQEVEGGMAHLLPTPDCTFPSPG